MRTYLDGSLLDGAGSTLGSALVAVREKAGSRLVVHVEIDGVAVPADDLTNPPTRQPYGGELRITTADAGDLLRDSLMYASGALRDLAPRQREAAEMIQMSKTSDAMGVLGDVLRSWEQAKQVLQLAGTLGVSMPTSEQSPEGAIGELARHLEELKRSLRAEDWSSLADVLAYDLPPLSDRWSAMLGELAISCSAAVGAPGSRGVRAGVIR